MIAGKSMRADRVKRSQDVQFAASHCGRITKCEDFSLHDENFSVLGKEERRVQRQSRESTRKSNFDFVELR